MNKVLAFVSNKGGVCYGTLSSYYYDGLADLLGRVAIVCDIVEYNPRAEHGAVLFKITERKMALRILGVVDVIEEVDIDALAKEYDKLLADIKAGNAVSREMGDTRPILN